VTAFVVVADAAIILFLDADVQEWFTAIYPVCGSKTFETVDDLFNSMDTTNSEWWIGLRCISVDAVSTFCFDMYS